MTARNIERRRRRGFRKLVNEHPILLILYKNDDIVKHAPELEGVLWDFYMAGVYNTLSLTAVAMHDILSRLDLKE